MRYDEMERILREGVSEGSVKDALRLYKEAEEKEIEVHASLSHQDYYPDWEEINGVTPFR